MSIKARFQQQQPPVDIRRIGGKIYVYICLNGREKTETYPDMGEGKTTETYYEYDYNEFRGKVEELDLEDIQSHPENYLDYQYTPVPDDPGTKALEEIEKLKAAIERGLTV